MGGYSFRSDLRVTDGDAPVEIAYFNLPRRNDWALAIEAAGETSVLDNAKCPFDEDGECLKRGCLNKDQFQRGWQMSLRGFILSQERALAFAKEHPERLPDRTTCWHADGSEDKQPGATLAIPLLEAFIARLKQAQEKGAQLVFMWDRLSDPDAFPCPREWSSRRPPNADEIDEHLKHGWGIPAGIISGEMLPYDEAVTKLGNGEWEKNQEAVFAWEDSGAGGDDVKPEDLPF